MIARLNIKDEARYHSDVRPRLLELIRSCDGTVLAATMHAKPLVGEAMPGNRTVITAFPNQASIERWVAEAEAVEAEHTDVYEMVRLAAVPESDDEAAGAVAAE
jgi:uncharacterized protein (DUF1330 family)